MENLEDKIKAFLADGNGDGDGNGYGNGSGEGDGYGNGNGILNYCGHDVYRIDDQPTLIYHVRDNIAKGALIREDMSLAPCYIVKNDGIFAHGKTLREAQSALMDKLFDDMPVDDRIDAFVAAHKSNQTYPNTDYFDWHNKLTGSCLMGREEFARKHNVDMTGSMTVAEFISLTKDDYGRDVIRQLAEKYKEDKTNE